MSVKEKRKCGILVVRGGNAGLVAAIEGRNAWANVLSIEKALKRACGGRDCGWFFLSQLSEWKGFDERGSHGADSRS